MTHTPFLPAGRASPHRPSISQGACPFFVQSAAGRIFFKKYGPEGTPSGLSLSKNLCRKETAQVGAGELEGAAARLE